MWNVSEQTVVFWDDKVNAQVSFLPDLHCSPQIHLPASPCLSLASYLVLLTPAPPQHWPWGVSVLPYSIRFTIAGSMTLQLGKICPVLMLLTYTATLGHSAKSLTRYYLTLVLKKQLLTASFKKWKKYASHEMQNCYIYMMYHVSWRAVHQYFQETTVYCPKLQMCAKLADATNLLV